MRRNLCREVLVDGIPLMVDIHIWNGQACFESAGNAKSSAKYICISIEDLISEISIDVLYCLQCNCD